MESAFVEMLGYCAGGLTTAAFLPQVVQTWRSRSVRDISLPMYAIFAAGIAAWLVYGVLVGSWPVVVANAATLVLALAMIWMKLKLR